MNWVDYYYKMFVDLSEEAKSVTDNNKKEFRKKLDIYSKGWSRLNYADQGEVSFKISQHYIKAKDEDFSNNKNLNQE